MGSPEIYSIWVIAMLASGLVRICESRGPTEMCLEQQWKCLDGDSNPCLATKRRCTGYRSCGNELCEQWTCPPDMWKCREDQQCIRLKGRCDGDRDCKDKSDEKNCGYLSVDCPTYVMEKSNMMCTCRAKGAGKRHNITWPGHSENGTLTLTKVRRSDNGTQYMCLLIAKGIREELVYTLRVAYGPYPRQVSISPSHLVKNGSQPVTLTCNANDTYPTPYYEWGGVECESMPAINSCTFTPDPKYDNGKTVTCRAESVTLSDPSHEFHRSVRGTVSASLQMNITFLRSCGEGLVANASEQYIQSPGYPKGFERKLYCVWHITAPPGQLLWVNTVEMDLDRRNPCSRDSVTFYDGDEKTGKKIGEYCKRYGNTRPVMPSSGMATVVFVPGHGRGGRGFRLVYKTLSECIQNLTANSSTQTIQPPGYPVEYEKNMLCVWRITAPPGKSILMNFTDFDIENSKYCRWDSVKIYDAEKEKRLLGTYCGNKEYQSKKKFMPVISTSNVATFIFKSDVSNVGKGFSLQFQETA